jgi:hypothetical protein
LIVLALIPGCGLLYDLFYRETGSPELKVFESEKELADYFADQITTRNTQFYDVDTEARASEDPADGVFDMDDAAGGSQDAAPSPNAPSSEGSDGGDAAPLDSDYSQTTIQEEGVDEADVVKTDGQYLYLIDNGWNESTLRIVRVSPPEQLALLSEVPLEGYGQEIYLYDGKVVALTQTNGGFWEYGILPEEAELTTAPGSDGSVGIVDEVESTPVDEDGVAVTDETVDSTSTTAPEPDPMIDAETDLLPDDEGWTYRYERPQTIVTVVDVSDPETPVVRSESKFDGSQYANRMIDGLLHLVLANYQHYYYDVLPALGTASLDARSVDVTTLLPGYEVTGANGAVESGNVVTWRNLYRPTDPDGFGVVAIISLDVDDEAAFTAVGVVAEPGLIYSSLNALYLTDTAYTFNGGTRETTDIYKVAYVDRGALPTATGTVPGRILNQYSMGEYASHLRVATTVSGSFSPLGVRSEPYNNVYVMGQTGTTLEVVGRIENIAPGETIQSARFIGERGFVVTFEQIDPFFTLDLSDPTDPRVVGELKVPGFSTFLVPMDEDHVLAVGQYVPDEGPFFNWGVQLSIFDVSDFAAPERTANVVLGADGGGYSEALHNPKAFTYFAQRGLVALPITMYENPVFIDFDDGDVMPPDGDTVDSYWSDDFEGLVVFSVSATTGFTELGRISTLFGDAGYYWNQFTRGVFIADDVFAVTDRGVRGSPVDGMETTTYEIVFESEPIQEPWPADTEPGRAEAPVDDD